MGLNVRYVPNPGELHALLVSSGLIGRAVGNAAKVTAERAKVRVGSYGRVKTGRMRASIRPGDSKVSGDKVAVSVVAEASYSVFQHQGTRRGVRPAPFLTDALRDLKPGDFRA